MEMPKHKYEKIFSEATVGLLKLNYRSRVRQITNMRSKMNEFQKNALKAIFERTQFPTSETRYLTSVLIGVSERSVQIWFQNARQNVRKKGTHEIESKENQSEEVNEIPAWDLINIIKEA